MNLSIRTKLLAFGTIGVVISAVIGGMATFELNQLGRAVDRMQSGGAAVRHLMNADMNHDAVRSDVLAALLSTDAAELAAIHKEFLAHAEELRAGTMETRKLNINTEINEAIEKAQTPLEEYIQSAESIMKTANTHPEDAKAAIPSFHAAFTALETQLEGISDLMQRSFEDANTAADKLQRDALKEELAVFCGGLAAFSIASFFVIRSIRNPICALTNRAKDIAQGEADLTKRVDESSRDELGELGHWFNTFLSRIEDLISQVKSGALQIDAGGTQIASASQSLAQGASEQASSLEQISASVEQISGQTQQAAENARQAATLAEESKKSADRGQHEMIEMNKAVGEIKQSSAEISKIIKVIDEIAFQTNLLALNAAVEAARAGEAGKGFAVVAEEVRNLAQRSAEAAKNTSGMIEQSVKRSENGVAIASRVGTVLEEITSATSKVNALLAEIASASGEQATGIGQVNQGVSQLDQVTQQTAGNSEQLASSAEELSSQVASLNDLVNQFKVGDASSVHATPTRARVPIQVTGRSTTTPTSRTRTSKSSASSHTPHAPVKPSPEQVIPLENDETLSTF